MSIAPITSTLNTRDATDTREIVSDSLALGVLMAIGLTIIQRVLGFVRGILFCRMMTDEQLGQFSMISGALMMLAPLAVLGLPGSFGRFVEHYSHSGQLREFLRKSGRICMASTGLLAISILIFPDFFSWQIVGEVGRTDLMYLTAGGLILLTWCNYLTSLVESMRQIRLASIMRFVSGLTFTFGGIALVFLMTEKIQAALLAFALSSLLGAVPAWLYLRHRRPAIQRHDKNLPYAELWSRMAPFAAWWWFSNILHNGYEMADRYLLLHFSSLNGAEVQSAIGQIHSGRVLPTLMVGVAAMLSGLLMPYVTAAWIRGEHDLARSQLNWTIKLSAIGIMLVNVAILIVAPIMFETILQGRYGDGLALLPMAVVYCSWLSLMTVSQDYLWVIEKGRLAVVCLIFGMLVTVFTGWMLIPSHGLWGTVIATMAGNFTALISIYLCNFWTGCRPDFGVWMSVAIPTLALCDPPLAIFGSILILVLCLMTGLYFSKTEKKQIARVVAAKLGRHRDR